MDYLTFTKLHQKHKIKHGTFKASLKWCESDHDDAIFSFGANSGICCMLHINQALQGSIIDFQHDDQIFTLILDYVQMRDYRVYKVNFLLESVAVKK